jgi:hypothetical protein
LARYISDGIAGLLDHRRDAGREQVPASIRARVLVLSRTSPSLESGSSHWSSRLFFRATEFAETTVLSGTNDTAEPRL